MDDLSFGGRAFGRNVGPLLVIGFVWGAAVFVAYGITMSLIAVAEQSDVPNGGIAAVLGLAGLIMLLVAVVVPPMYVHAMLLAASGARVRLSHFFHIPHPVAALTTALLYFAAAPTAVSVLWVVWSPSLPLGSSDGVYEGAEVMLVLLGIGLAWLLIGVATALYSVFALLAVTLALDRGFRPVAAGAASGRLLVHHAGTALLLALAVGVLYVIGSFVCGVGLVAAVPIACGAVVAAYRRLLGQALAV